MKKFVKLLLLSLPMVPVVFGQSIVTDRPDFTESTTVVSFRKIQIESGCEYAAFTSLKELSFPNTLVRIGLGRQLEARLGFSGWTKDKMDSHSSTYLNDMALEAKYHITGKEAKVPLAIVLVSTLPTGDKQVRVEAPEFGLKFAGAKDLSANMSLSSNLGAISVDVNGKRKWHYLSSLSMGINISDRLGSFVEMYAEFPPEQTWQPALDCGLTYLLHRNAQIDFYIGKGLYDGTANVIIGSGFSFRFDY
jgi:hypothetical protein